MDTFMDKLAQRLNAQEIIKANTAAETAELSRMKEQIALYEEILKQVREEGEKSALHVQRLEQGAARTEQSAVRTMQSAERLEEELNRMEQDTDKLGRSVLRTEQNTENFELGVAKVERGAEQIEQGAEKLLQSFSLAEQNADRLEAAAARTEQGAAQLEQSAAHVERGAERLEQNAEKTEALIESGMAKFAELQAAGQNTEELNALLSALKEAQAERFDQLGEHMHRESVKVYRNVQAVVVDETAKQNEASGKNTSAVSGKLGAVLGISVVALLVSAAGLAFQILVYLHII